MDKQLLAALDNLSIALEMLSESLSKKDSSSPVASAVKSGNFEDQLKSISKGIADIKSDNKKILDNQETILKLQREKKDKSMNAFEGSGKENNKKMLKDGISIIVLIAGAVLAIGLAFKLIGTVDWKSVLSISIALPMMAYAFEKVAQVKDLTPAKVFMVGLALVGISVAMVLSSRILQKVVPIGLFQALTVVFIAAAFGAAAVGIGFLLKAFKNIKAADALKASIVLPIVLLAVSIAIAASSFVLQAVQPIGLAQAFTVVLIAAAFGVVSFGLGKLLGAFKNIKVSDAVAAAKLMPVILIALSVAIVGASYLFSLIQPIGFFQALTAIVIAATFVVLSYSVKPLMNGVKGVSQKDIINGTIVLLALSAAVVAASWLLMLMAPVPFTTVFKFLILSVSLSVSVMALAIAVKFVNKLGNPKDYFEGGLSIVIMATTIMISSWMISMGTYTNYPPLMWTLFSGLAIAAFALVTWLVVKLGNVKDYVQGGLSIVILSATIMISSYLISAGDYSNYPPIMWSIGTVISIGLFGVAAVLLSTLLLNPMFYMGLAVIVIIAASIVAVSYILSSGNYEKYPTLDWAMGVGAALGFFGLTAVLLGLQVFNPFFYTGLGMIAVVALAIVGVSYIFEQGTYKVYPPDEWVNPTMFLIGKFALITSVLALAFPFIALGTVSLILIVVN